MSEQASQVITTPEGGVEADDIDAVAIGVWGSVAVLIVVITILGATALYNMSQSQLTQKRVVEAKYHASDRAISEQQSLLVNYKAPTAGQSGYIIPIDEAKELVLRELQETSAAE